MKNILFAAAITIFLGAVAACGEKSKSSGETDSLNTQTRQPEATPSLQEVSIKSIYPEGVPFFGAWVGDEYEKLKSGEFGGVKFTAGTLSGEPTLNWEGTFGGDQKVKVNFEFSNGKLYSMGIYADIYSLKNAKAYEAEMIKWITAKMGEPVSPKDESGHVSWDDKKVSLLLSGLVGNETEENAQYMIHITGTPVF